MTQAELTPKSMPRKVVRTATSAVASAAVGASWMALLAATTVGLGHLDRVRTRVTADSALLGEDNGRFRLVVQSYAPASVGGGSLPGTRHKPLASAQRSVTAEDLARGVAIDVLRVGESDEGGSPVIVAWIERGEPDLEFDGAEARPHHADFFGITDSKGVGSARVVLRARGTEQTRAA